MDWLDRCHFGDCRETMRAMIADGAKVRTIVTSPPYYGLRDYGHVGQLGLEKSPDAYIAAMVEVFRAARDVLVDDGTLWLNIGDSYAGSWGSQGRQGNTGQMAGRSVANVRERSKIQAARIEVGAYPSKVNRTGTIPAASDLKPKDLIGIPWMLAFALRADGWYLRQEIIWHKPNPMPESVRDRCTKAHESLFLLAKSGRYFYQAEAIAQPLAETSVDRLGQPNLHNQTGSDRVPGKTNGSMKAVGPRIGGNKYGDDDREESRTKSGSEWTGETGRANRRSVWTIATTPYKGAHFATFPQELVEPCVLAGSRPGDIVFDPFFGSGTTGQVAQRLGRHFIGCELNPAYETLQRDRLRQPGFVLEVS
ncbi:DNA-methyltransferase [Paraburkholderia tuberum]|uniref:Methyltransferase n=1 Tax=Paraburkholderia tuberum TaxID=157910 RepID=A0A1H1JTE0_9BURK|nr:site-specific DNA-methyltransferase [Paraburkholderia tuberum]SDR52777.1 DNA methylase [Paraburkholderia tuberum]